ncbi:MAG: Calcium-binding component of the spindle pole body (SPB) half-bridge, partial [Candelina submexicana]
RLERERAERERLEREGQNVLSELSEEQREEINEAVSLYPPPPKSHISQTPPKKRGELAERGGRKEGEKEKANIITTPIFGLFDLDKDKKIDYHELKVAMKALGFDLPKSEILSILQTHGVPSTPSASSTTTSKFAAPTRLLLPLSSFQALMSQRILARDPREEILRAFELFDEGGKGKINLNDLRRVARELGEGLEEDELVAMIEEFDMDGDGAIGREEFVGICMQ